MGTHGLHHDCWLMQDGGMKLLIELMLRSQLESAKCNAGATGVVLQCTSLEACMWRCNQRPPTVLCDNIRHHIRLKRQCRALDWLDARAPLQGTGPDSVACMPGVHHPHPA